MSTTEQMTLTLSTSVVGATALVAARGELDIQSAAELDAAVDALLEQQPRTIAVDLRELEFVDSRGLRAIVLAHRRCAARDVRFAVIRGTRQVARLLEIARIGDHIEIVDGYEALAGPGTGAAPTAIDCRELHRAA
jgi:anti-sigma B factor antagonist